MGIPAWVHKHFIENYPEQHAPDNIYLQDAGVFEWELLNSKLDITVYFLSLQQLNYNPSI